MKTSSTPSLSRYVVSLLLWCFVSIIPPALAATVPLVDQNGNKNLARLPGVQADASSVHSGSAAANLRDGVYGVSNSWVSNTVPSSATPVWAELNLGQKFWIDTIVLGSDRNGTATTGGIASLRILAATSYATSSTDPAWVPIATYPDPANPNPQPAIYGTQTFAVSAEARWVRVEILGTDSGNARIDELEIYEQTNAQPNNLLPSPTTIPIQPTSPSPYNGQTTLGSIFLGPGDDTVTAPALPLPLPRHGYN